MGTVTDDIERRESTKRDNGEGRQLSPEQAAAAAMVAEARACGLELTGPSGLLKLFTKNVLETALNEEMTEHLGHEKHQADPGRDSTNVRNGSRSKRWCRTRPARCASRFPGIGRARSSRRS